MSAVYLIRHGQAGLRQSYDTLSDAGRAQARLLGVELARHGVRFAAIYSGGLARQRQTAEEVRAASSAAGAALPEIRVDERWNEFDLDAVYKGMAPHLAADDSQFRQEYEQMLRAYENDKAPVHRTWTRCDIETFRAWVTARYPFDGESWRDFQTRVLSPLQTLAHEEAGGPIAVFTSATPIGLWVGHALGLDDSRSMRLAGVVYNSSISQLRVRGGELTLFSFNCVSHLADPALRTFR